MKRNTNPQQPGNGRSGRDQSRHVYPDPHSRFRRDIPDYILLMISLIVCVGIVCGCTIYWIRPLHQETVEIETKYTGLAKQKTDLAEDVISTQIEIAKIRHNEDSLFEHKIRELYNIMPEDEIKIKINIDDSPKENLKQSH